MPSRLTLLPGLALAVVLAATVPVTAEDAPTRDTVVAVVNGQEIKLGHMALAYATLPQEYQQLPSDVLFQAILDQLIQQTALSQAQGEDVPAYVEMALENERRSLLAGENLDRIMSDAVSDDDLRAAYDAEFADMAPGEEYNAAHILVPTEEEALAIKADLDAGADFAATAQEKSTGPSGPNGGALGWFGAGQMVPDFEAAVIALEPGDISDPVQTQFGWHVILLRETRPVSAPEFEEVRGQLLQQLQGEAMETYVSGLTDDATVDRPDLSAIQPDAIRSLDILRN